MKAPDEITDILQKVASERSNIEAGLIEEFAKAFIAHTGFKPTECELMIQWEDLATCKYYFRKRRLPYDSPGKWNAEKLDALKLEMENRVKAGNIEEMAANVPESERDSNLIGYWMLQLEKCREAI